MVVTFKEDYLREYYEKGNLIIKNIGISPQ